MENVCAIYIDKQYEALTIYNNEFKANMGMFGPAITLNNVADGLDVAQDISLTTPTLYSKAKIIINNRFINNFAYFSGGAVYVNQYKEYTYAPACSGLFLRDNTFYGNYNHLFSSGGAFSAQCTGFLNEHREKIPEMWFNQPGAATLQVGEFSIFRSFKVTHPITEEEFGTYAADLRAVTLEQNLFESNFAGF